MPEYTFTNDDCRRARTCCCGFCKRWTFTGTDIIRDCDYGDCRRTATTNCPRFGYPVCEKHAHANCHSHAVGADCATVRAA